MWQALSKKIVFQLLFQTPPVWGAMISGSQSLKQVRAFFTGLPDRLEPSAPPPPPRRRRHTKGHTRARIMATHQPFQNTDPAGVSHLIGGGSQRLAASAGGGGEG